MRLVASGLVTLGLLCFCSAAKAQNAAPYAESSTSPAQNTAPTFTLDYVPTPGCPAQIELERAVLRRVPHAQITTGPAADVRLRAELTSAPPHVQGVLWVELADGTRTLRHVDAESCAEAVDYMGLIVAMVLDPAATQAQPPRTAGDALAVPAKPQPGPVPQRRVAPVRRVSVGQHWQYAGFIGGSREAAVAPSAPFAVLVGAEISRGRPSADPLPYWSLSARLGLLYTATASRFTGGPKEATFQLMAARIGVCPRRTAGRLRLDLCAEMDIGSLSVESDERQKMSWLAAGPATRAEFGLSPTFGVELGGGVRGLLHHDRFLFGSQVIHDVPSLSWHLDLGVTIRSR